MRCTSFAIIALLLLAALPAFAQTDDRAQAEKMALDLKAQVAANPADAALRTQLVLLHLVALDDPASASQFLAEGIDANLRKYVPGAAKPVAAAPEIACLELATWYRSLAGAAYPWARWSMLARSRGYYRRYLALHPANDSQRTDAEKTLKGIQDDMDELCADPLTAPEACHLSTGRWAELLLFPPDLAKDAQGKLAATGWTQKGATLTASDPGRDSPRTELPVCLQGSYELRVQFVATRTTANSLVLLFLPVGAGYTTLKCGAKSAGLDKVAGRGPNDNDTLFAVPLTASRSSLIEVQVTLTDDKAAIVVAWDGKVVLRWQGQQSDLTAWSGLRKKDHLGLGFQDGTVTFTSVRARSISGKNVCLRPPPDTPRKPDERAAPKPPPAPPKIAAPATPAPAPAAPGTAKATEWIDLLALLDPMKDAGTSTPPSMWVRQGQSLTGTTTSKRDQITITAPVTPEGDYELRLRFTPGKANGDVFIFLPFKGGSVSLLVTTGKSGLYVINSLRPMGNPEAASTVFFLRRPSEVTARVSTEGDQVAIDADMDGKPVVRWKGSASALTYTWTPPPPVRPTSSSTTTPTRLNCTGDKSRLGIGLYESIITIDSMQLRMLSGKAKMLR